VNAFATLTGWLQIALFHSVLDSVFKLRLATVFLEGHVIPQLHLTLVHVIVVGVELLVNLLTVLEVIIAVIMEFVLCNLLLPLVIVLLAGLVMTVLDLFLKIT